MLNLLSPSLSDSLGDGNLKVQLTFEMEID